jgi:hypothetical protein
VKKKPGSKQDLSCATCGARCCRYVATQIDTPDCKRDYDNIRWYLLHRDVYVFIDHDDDWYLEFETDCTELDDNHRCVNYDSRPRLCRLHGEDDDGPCEFATDEEPFKIRFANAREFEAYLDEHGIKWRRKRVRAE